MFFNDSNVSLLVSTARSSRLGGWAADLLCAFIRKWKCYLYLHDFTSVIAVNLLTMREASSSKGNSLLALLCWKRTTGHAVGSLLILRLVKIWGEIISYHYCAICFYPSIIPSPTRTSAPCAPVVVMMMMVVDRAPSTQKTFTVD